MKRIRVPWIRCRADELGSLPCELEWRGTYFEVLAYSEAEARAWWRSLSESERGEQVGCGAGVEGAGLF